jgi:glycosyltransferase involved in cell wall biosynthesis
VNIVFLTTRLFDQPRNGGEICTARLLRQLALLGHHVHLIGRGELPAAKTGAMRITSLGPLVRAFEELRPWQQAASLCAALTARQASTVQRLCAGQVTSQLEQLLLDPGALAIDALVVDHLQAYAWIAPLQARLPKPLLVMHNVESDGYLERAREAETSGPKAAMRAAIFRREANLIKQLEQLALRQAAAVACLSEHDAQRMQELAAGTARPLNTEVLPAYPLLPPSPPQVRRPQPKFRIGMLGTWTWGPNRMGLNWMIDKVLPHLDPACELWLAGTGLHDHSVPARVRDLGRIDDVQAFYASVDALAIASLGGSGVQEKAVEAIGSGRPVVATSHALRGLAAAPAFALPANVSSSDDPTQFAGLCRVAGTHAQSGTAESVQRWTGLREQSYRAALGRCLQAAALTPAIRAQCGGKRRRVGAAAS